MSKNTIIAVVAIIIIGAILLWAPKKARDTAPEDTVNTNITNNNSGGAAGTNNGTLSEPEITIRKNVIEVGKRMKLLNSMAGDYKNQVQVQYGMYVTPALLAEWKKDPSQALVRTTLSPWPDRIDITKVTKVDGDTYKIEANVIEVGADSPTPVSMYPVTITVEDDRGVWLITGVTK